jgi:signal transduction histidine kinase
VQRPRAAGAVDDEALRAALDVLPDGVVVLDASGAVVFANPAAVALFGYPPDDLVGRPFDHLVPDAANGANGEVRGCDRAGRRFPVDLRVDDVATATGNQTVAVVRDLTDHREAADRERVARDLHDTTIQRLFAAGMSLQGALSRSTSADVNHRIEVAIEDIDGTIRDIRTAIFSLQSAPGGPTGARDTVLAITRDAAAVLGCDPHVEFAGLVDTDTPDDVRERLAVVLRDVLADLAEAEPTRVVVSVEVGTEVVLRVAHDGAREEGAVFEWRAPAHGSR